MSLAFLEMDESDGSCPHCNRYDGGLIFTSFSVHPISCESCLWAMKAEGANVEYLEKLRRDRDEAHNKMHKELKRVALELGRTRLERMNK